MLRLSRRVLALTGLVLGGCASPVPPADGPGLPARWLLTWHRPLAADAAAVRRFEQELSAVARVTVRRLAAVDEHIVAVGIDCADESRCQAARDRLAGDPRVVDLRPDGRRRLPGS